VRCFLQIGIGTVQEVGGVRPGCGAWIGGLQGLRWITATVGTVVPRLLDGGVGVRHRAERDRELNFYGGRRDEVRKVSSSFLQMKRNEI
jgi:hypothetical protein